MNGLVVNVFKAHTVEYGANFYLVMVAISRGDLLVQIFVLGRKGAVFVTSFLRLRKQSFRFAKGVNGTDIRRKNFTHFFENGVV